MSETTQQSTAGVPAADFERIFERAGVLTDELAPTKSARAKATKMGAFLSQNIDREVPIEANGRTGKARLRMRSGRSKKKLYYFEVRWDEPEVSAAGAKHGLALDDGLGAEAPRAAAAVNSGQLEPSEPSGPAVPVSGDQVADGTGNREEW